MNNLLQKATLRDSENGHQNGNHISNGGSSHTTITSESMSSEQGDKMIVDLDAIIEKYILWAWETNKSKQQSKLDFEDLDVNVSWKRVDFIQEEPKFEKSRADVMPNTQTLFRTFFTNKTDLDQEYSFKTERKTRQSCTFSFVRGFSKEKEGGITFKLPQEIVEIGGGIRTEQSVEFGKDETKEQEISWGVDSIIRVPPHTCTTAELVITEQQFDRNFTVDVKMKGKISVVVSNKRENNAFVKKMGADIVEIFRLANDANWIPKNSSIFEIIEIKGVKHVKTTLKGRCKFRLGISQHVTLQQQNIKKDFK